MVTLARGGRAFFRPAHSYGCDDGNDGFLSNPETWVDRGLGHSPKDPETSSSSIHDTVCSIQGTDSTEIVPTADQILP